MAVAFSPNATYLAVSSRESPCSTYSSNYSDISYVSCPTYLGIGLMGTAQPGTNLTVAVDGVPHATSFANVEGNFILPSIMLASGRYCLTVVDTSTGCSSIPVCVTISVNPYTFGVPNLAFNVHCNR